MFFLFLKDGVKNFIMHTCPQIDSGRNRRLKSRCVQVPCEDENVNIPVRLQLSYDHFSHSCRWPDLLPQLGCNPEQLFGFTCPALEGIFFFIIIILLFYRIICFSHIKLFFTFILK